MYHCTFLVYSSTCNVVHSTMYSIQCTMYNVQCIIYIIQFAMYNIQFVMYNVQCTMCSVHSTYSKHIAMVRCSRTRARLRMCSNAHTHARTHAHIYATKHVRHRNTLSRVAYAFWCNFGIMCFRLPTAFDPSTFGLYIVHQFV